MSKYIISKNSLSHAGIKGMKWGVRRYQNDDGSLTDLGRKRYAKQLNKTYDDEFKKGVDQGMKNPKKSIDEIKSEAHNRAVNATHFTTFDADAEAKKDFDSAKTVLREGDTIARTVSGSIKNIPVNVKRMDLSKMSDTDMRNQINRERLEAEYDGMFNHKRRQIESGKQTVAAVIAGLGTAMVITSSALEIAKAVKQLKS